MVANGGSVHAESEGPNLGTTISLRLPMTAADMRNVWMRSMAKVLVIHDETQIRRFLRA
jgi:chemotaxis protein histidine kinase CheA